MNIIQHGGEDEQAHKHCIVNNKHRHHNEYHSLRYRGQGQVAGEAYKAQHHQGGASGGGIHSESPHHQSDAGMAALEIVEHRVQSASTRQKQAKARPTSA